MQVELPRFITMDGVNHELAQFSDKVKQLVAIFQTWDQDAGKVRLELSKVEAAQRQLSSEISALVATELKAKAEAEAEQPAQPAPEFVNIG